MILNNTGTVSLENWRIKVTFQHEITSIWDGEIESHKGNVYIIKHPSWNQKIPVGGKAVIGFNGKKNGTLLSPTDCSLLIGNTETPKEDYSISYRTSSDWGDAFNGEISITNNTDKVIAGWKLEFDYDKTIKQFWNAKLVKHEKNHYTIKHDDWNSVIKSGETIKIGFEAQPGPATTEPENYKLTKSKMDTGDTEDEKIDYKKDTDGDGLPDALEEEGGTDMNNPDTDGDGLFDLYEYLCWNADPLLADTDGDGVPDGDEDSDMDYLTNLEEFKLKTDSTTDNTDEDGLSDIFEVQIYHTDPLKADTDGDGLCDGDEVAIKTNPLLPDSDGNGIIDIDEKILQSLDYDITGAEASAIVKAEIKMACTQNIVKTTSISNTYDTSVFASEVVGRVGGPIEFNSMSKFDNATITFSYDPTLDSALVDQLGLLFYNEEENTYKFQPSSIDRTNHTLSSEITPSALGTYIVINRAEWEEAWNHEIKYQNPSLAVSKCDIAFVLDNSNSMNEKRLSMSKKGLTEFIQTLEKKDRGALFSFTAYNATMKKEMSSDKDQLLDGVKNLKIEESAKRTVPDDTINKGLDMAVEHLKDLKSKQAKLIVLFVDGDMRYSNDIVDKAKNSGIKLFVVNVGKMAEHQNLKKMIHQMGGYYYDVATSTDIVHSLKDMEKIIKTGIDTKDTDGDGLFDIYETLGMQITNGQVETMNPKKADTDGDGLSDFEEMNGSWVTIINRSDVLGTEALKRKATIINQKKQQKTDEKVKKIDTDKDNISDKYDPRPRSFNINDIFIDKLIKLDNLVTQYCKENSISQKKHDWYIFMFFRNYGSKYHTDNWNILAGKVDTKFINYVKTKNKDLYNYFSKRKNQIIPANEKGDTIDLIHFGGTMSIQLHDTTLIDSIENGEDIVKLSGIAPEELFNSMGGWAGDLQQVIWRIFGSGEETNYVEFTELKKKVKGTYNLTYAAIGADFPPFSKDDLYADIDVIMIERLRRDGTTITNCFFEYYGNKNYYMYRINNFIAHLSEVDNANIKETEKMLEIRKENKRKERVLKFTSENYMGIKWPFFKTKKVSISKKDSILARDAFLDYLDAHREYYITDPKNRN